MEQRLKNLKKAAAQTAFSKVDFNAKLQAQVHQEIQALSLKETILSLLLEARSGVELTQLLHVRGVQQIVDNEGLIYAILHEAAQQGWLETSWVDDVKYYRLTKLDKKQLQQDRAPTKRSLKERLLGVRLHAE